MTMRAFAQNQHQRRASFNLTSSHAAESGARRHAHPILHLQRTMGNQAVQRLLQASIEGLEAGSDNTAIVHFAHDVSRIPIYTQVPEKTQTKLTVNNPGDVSEQEADRVADQLMRMPDVRLQRACSCGRESPRRQSEQRSEEHGLLQTGRVPATDKEKTLAPPIVHEVLHASGQPMDPDTRAFFERRFGHDFSRVRVHTGALAAAAARAVDARAFAVDRNLVFGAGQYAPRTAEGKKLLAHELAHVAQQGRESASPTVIRRQPDPRKELDRQLREKETRLAELQSRIQALSDQLTTLRQRRIDVASEKQRRADERAARVEARAAHDPVLRSTLPVLRRAIRVEQTATTIRFVATMEITFQGLSATAGSSRAATEIPRLVQAIQDAWTVAFTEGAYKGIAFSIDPRITYRDPTTPPNPNAWQIEVRSTDDKQGNVGTAWSGIISMNPAHLQGDRVRVIGHELYHLFGRLLDMYMAPPEDSGGKAVAKPNVSVGRPDPKGRPDLVGAIDPVVLKRWLDKGYISRADFDRQTGTMPKVWQEDLEQILQDMGVMTPRQLEMEQIAQRTNRRVQEALAARVEGNTMEWLTLAEESMRLEKEIASLRSRLGQPAPKQPKP